MKISHVKKEKPVFLTLGDLSKVVEYVRADYNPSTCDCKVIAETVANCFSNVEARQISLLIYRGRFESRNHWINVLDGGKYIIDLTGDQFSFINPSKLKHELVPWIYKEVDGVYYSVNHMPVDQPEELSESPSDIELITFSNNPFYKGLRCIIL